MIKRILFLIICFSFLNSAHANQEPAYCDPNKFSTLEFNPNELIFNDHTYRLGDVILLGGAIGLSRTKDVIEYALNYSNTTEKEKYCTWYFNEGATNAEKKFNHFYVNHPKNLTVTSGPAEYRSVLKDQFAKAPTSFLSCLEKHKFLTMGCNGQRHRGPTVFGMLLSFSGCHPKNSATIVNKAWGLNGIKPEVRLAIIEEGYKLGNEDPNSRKRMQQAFGY